MIITLEPFSRATGHGRTDVSAPQPPPIAQHPGHSVNEVMRRFLVSQHEAAPPQSRPPREKRQSRASCPSFKSRHISPPQDHTARSVISEASTKPPSEFDVRRLSRSGVFMQEARFGRNNHGNSVGPQIRRLVSVGDMGYRDGSRSRPLATSRSSTSRFEIKQPISHIEAEISPHAVEDRRQASKWESDRVRVNLRRSASVDRSTWLPRRPSVESVRTTLTGRSGVSKRSSRLSVSNMSQTPRFTYQRPSGHGAGGPLMEMTSLPTSPPIPRRQSSILLSKTKRFEAPKTAPATPQRTKADIQNDQYQRRLLILQDSASRHHRDQRRRYRRDNWISEIPESVISEPVSTWSRTQSDFSKLPEKASVSFRSAIIREPNKPLSHTEHSTDYLTPRGLSPSRHPPSFMLSKPRFSDGPREDPVLELMTATELERVQQQRNWERLARIQQAVKRFHKQRDTATWIPTPQGPPVIGYAQPSDFSVAPTAGNHVFQTCPRKEPKPPTSENLGPGSFDCQESIVSKGHSTIPRSKRFQDLQPANESPLRTARDIEDQVRAGKWKRQQEIERKRFYETYATDFSRDDWIWQ
eukprot:c11164_g1_i1.p1 GENE.c11164_g1_i1~~c11164_g1_i1.p1  ORF type:complete len:583 (+),score=32.68 c11164_g1_i1:22-1770(+)